MRTRLRDGQLMVVMIGLLLSGFAAGRLLNFGGVYVQDDLVLGIILSGIPLLIVILVIMKHRYKSRSH